MSARADHNNPWLGLEAYTPDDREFFFGREDEIDQLLQMVRDEPLVVFYGVSGMGKTSLLSAGLIPHLREEDYLPVRLRLDYAEAHPEDEAPAVRLEGDTPESGGESRPRGPPAASLAHQVISRCRSEAAAREISAPPGSARTLWEYFHHRETLFWSKRHRLQIPVLIFDQFEEIFTLGQETPARAERTEDFLQQLSDLVCNRPPAGLKRDLEERKVDPEDYTFEPIPLRVVLTLREDFLPQFSELRGRGFPTLLEAALRLHPLSLAAAKRCIEEPVPELLEPGIADLLVAFLAAKESGPGRATAPLVPRDFALGKEPVVEPALLSVVCRGLNAKRQHLGLDRINADLLKLSREQIIDDFYDGAFEGVGPALRGFVERELLSPDGYRDSRFLRDALNRPGIVQSEIDRLINGRLLHYQDRHGEPPRLELSHDLLCGAAQRGRFRHETRGKLNRLRVRFRNVGWGALAALALVVGMWVGAERILSAWAGADARIRSMKKDGSSSIYPLTAVDERVKAWAEAAGKEHVQAAERVVASSAEKAAEESDQSKFITLVKVYERARYKQLRLFAVPSLFLGAGLLGLLLYLRYTRRTLLWSMSSMVRDVRAAGQAGGSALLATPPAPWWLAPLPARDGSQVKAADMRATFGSGSGSGAQAALVALISFACVGAFARFIALGEATERVIPRGLASYFWSALPVFCAAWGTFQIYAWWRERRVPEVDARGQVTAGVSRREALVGLALACGAVLIDARRTFLALHQPVPRFLTRKRIRSAPEPTLQTGQFRRNPRSGVFHAVLPKKSGSSALTVEDLVDLPAFVRKLRQRQDPVSAYLVDQFSEQTRQALKNEPAAGADSAPVRELLVRDINRIIRGRSLHEPERFARVAVRPTTRARLSRTLEGQRLARRNRLLLEDAYPGEIARGRAIPVVHCLPKMPAALEPAKDTEIPLTLPLEGSRKQAQAIPRVQLSRAASAFEQAALRSIAAKDIDRACQLLLAGVKHDLWFSKGQEGREPSFHIYDLLAGLAARHRKEQVLKDLDALIASSPEKAMLESRQEKWRNRSSPWHKRWSDISKLVSWSRLPM